jgi:hypothetical protein
MMDRWTPERFDDWMPAVSGKIRLNCVLGLIWHNDITFEELGVLRNNSTRV